LFNGIKKVNHLIVIFIHNKSSKTI